LLLQAATELFAIHGYAMTKIEDIAERAGFSKATIYNYFDTKEDLFLALVDDIFEFIHSGVDDILNQNKSFIETIEEYVDFSFRSLTSNSDFFRIIMMEHYKFCDDLRDRIPPTVHAGIEGLKSRLFGFFEANKKYLRKGFDPKDATIVLMGVVSSFVGEWMWASDEFDLESKRDLIVDFFLRGVTEKGKG